MHFKTICTKKYLENINDFVLILRAHLAPRPKKLFQTNRTLKCFQTMKQVILSSKFCLRLKK